MNVITYAVLFAFLLKTDLDMIICSFNSSQITVSTSLSTYISYFFILYSDKRPTINHMHRKALKKCHPLLTSDLELFTSSIIDDLIASDVMSESDMDSIRGKHTRRGQNEEFLSFIKGRLSFEDFKCLLLPALRKDHPHLAEALISELNRPGEEHEDEKCVACRARKYVTVRENNAYLKP